MWPTVLILAQGALFGLALASKLEIGSGQFWLFIVANPLLTLLYFHSQKDKK